MDLDSRCIEINKRVYRARQDLYFIESISKYARDINLHKCRHFFGLVQNLALRVVIIGICCVYERESTHSSLLSIPALCNAIRRDGIIKDRKQLINDLPQLGIKIKGLACEHRSDKQIINEFVSTISDVLDLKTDTTNISKEFEIIREGLKKAKKVRDKMITHFEKVTKTLYGPSIDEVNALLLWAERFTQFTWNHFINMNVWVSSNVNAKDAQFEIEKLLSELGILKNR